MASSTFSKLYPQHNVYDYRLNFDPKSLGNYGKDYEKSWYEKAGGDWLGSAALGAGLNAAIPGLGYLPQLANDINLKAIGLGGLGDLFGGQDVIPWHYKHTPYGPYPHWGDPLASFSGYANQPKAAAAPGTTTYSPLGWETSADAAKEASLALEGLPGGSHKSYRTVRNWADWWRTAVGQSMGTLENQPPLDPLAQLQGQLVGQIGGGMGDGLSAMGQSQAYSNQMADALRQRAAGMGMSDIYDPALSLQQRTVDTAARQAEAAYRPLAWQQRQQYDTQVQQLLQAIQQSEFMRDMAIESAGR